MIFTAILLSFIPALTILGIQYWLRDPEHMEKYEKEFLQTHKDVVDIYNDLVPSGFNTEDTQFLLHVCAEAQKLGKQRDEQQPEVQHHHIDFKKVSHPPFFVEVIRCCSKFAVIKAPQKQSAYLLRVGKRNPKIPTEIFFFFSKFLYYKRNLSPEEIQTRIEMYNNHQQQLVGNNKEELSGRVKNSSTSDSGSEFSQEYNFSWLFENEGKLDADGSALLTGGKSSAEEEVEESNKKSRVVTTSSEKSELLGDNKPDEQPEPLQSGDMEQTTQQKDKKIHRESFEKSVPVSNPRSADVETFVEEINDHPLPLPEPQERSDKIVENKTFGVDSRKSETLIQNPSSADLTTDQKVEEISGVASSDVTHATGEGMPPSKLSEFKVTAKSQSHDSPSLVTEKELSQKDDKSINKDDQVKTEDQSKTFITNSIESYQHELLESTRTLFPFERRQKEELSQLEWNTSVTREREKWNARAKAMMRKNHFSNHPTFINPGRAVAF